jgi:hypothetical protein
MSKIGENTNFSTDLKTLFIIIAAIAVTDFS